MKTFILFVILYLSVFVASAQRISDFPNNAHPGNGDLILFQSGVSNFNTTFGQLQNAIVAPIATATNSITSQYVTSNPLTNSITGSAVTARFVTSNPLTNSITGTAASAANSTNFFGLLSNTNLPSPLYLGNGSNLPPSALTSGGAVSGQTLSWNGSAWVPVTPGAGTNSVATNVIWPVIGDTHLVGVTNNLTVTLSLPWTNPTNEYWISANAVTNSDGTQLRPFDGSTQVKFDAVMKAVYTNRTTVHLGAGEFRTQGKQSSTNIWSTPSDSRLIGSGMGATTIKLEDNPVVGNAVIVTPGNGNPSPPPVVTPLVTNVEICDLTVDCNGANLGTTHRSHSGIIFNGAYRSALRRVHVINQIGDITALTGGESFGLQTEAGFNGTTISYDPATRTIIDSCVVSDVISNNNSLISPGAGCDVINSYVYMPIITNGVTPGYPSGLCSGFNHAGNDTRILNCSSFGGTAGIYSDTWACTNIVIANCTIREALFGIELIHSAAGSPIVGVIIANNTIQLSPYGQSAAGFLAGIYCPALADRDYIITGNKISWDKPGSGQPQYGFAISLGGITGAIVTGNILDDANLESYLAVTGLNYHGNVNLNGQQPNFYNGTQFIYQTNINQFVLASNYIGGLAFATNLPLSGLAQSGASTGSIPAWNGSAWVPTNSLVAIATYATSATNVLINILTNKIDGTNLISGGATAGLVPVADGTGKVAWGGVNAAQSPLTNNVNAAGFSATNYGTLQATNFDINGTGAPTINIYDAGANLLAGFASSNWFGPGAGLTNVIPATRQVNKTSNYPVTTADNGTYFNNYGAGAPVMFTLPNSIVGLHYNFVVLAGFNVTVKASNPDVIVLGYSQSSAGGFIYSPWAGDVIHVFCPVTNIWFCDGVGPSSSWIAN